MARPLTFLIAFGALSLAVAARAACGPGLHPAVTAELFFGRDVGTGLGVTDGDWQAFMDAEVTPRFPAGVSVWDDAGQWREADGKLVREPSKVVLIVLSGAPDEPAKLSAVRNAYKALFHQQSVLLVESEACVAF